MTMIELLMIGEIIIGGLIALHMVSNHVIARKTLNISVLDIQLRTNLNPGISDTLDEFIQECFNDYTLLNLAYVKDQYISSEAEQKIVSDIATIVSDRISPTMFKQLSVYYNEKAIAGIISNKIYELVMMYTIEMNKPKEELPGED